MGGRIGQPTCTMSCLRVIPCAIIGRNGAMGRHGLRYQEGWERRIGGGTARRMQRLRTIILSAGDQQSVDAEGSGQENGSMQQKPGAVRQQVRRLFGFCTNRHANA